MKDYLFLMHDDATGTESAAAWATDLAALRATGRFDGGSAIGGGTCVAKARPASGLTAHLSGYLRVQAASLDDAKRLLDGNPVFEAGGTVEIRELPRE